MASMASMASCILHVCIYVCMYVCMYVCVERLKPAGSGNTCTISGETKWQAGWVYMLWRAFFSM